MRAGGATVVPLRGDDRITVRDPDGAQPAELTVLAPDGREDPGALGVRHDAPASDAGRVPRRGRRAAGRPLRCGCSAPDSPPGAQQTFRAEREARRRDRRPGGPAGRRRLARLGPRASRCAGRVPRALEEVELPAPLAEPRLDFRVDRATALSYEVRKGEYIQVLDVQGRQCSDFLAFHAGKLQRGLERGLDATTTRTLMGNAYPMPGLHGKFYDPDMDPLVEVVRDTVGRHDTFGARLHVEVLRGRRLLRPRQLHRQLQRRSSTPYGDRARARAGRR